MGIIHFMNVKEGDCTWINHLSGNNTVIDVSNGNDENAQVVFESFSLEDRKGGNHQQKKNPVNPIDYLQNFNVSSIFRFILTHPDMDHMDGIKALFDSFDVTNFWDTENDKSIAEFNEGKYKKEDWDFYQNIRKSSSSPKVLNIKAGSRGQYYNKDKEDKSGGDGLYILAPTSELVDEANSSEDYNDCSYVILYRTGNNKKIIFAGDSSTKIWNYILENHKDDVSNIDVLLAPHHGRKTGGNDEYLDVLKPKLTLFGNAKSKHLDYNSWNSRDLFYITNNQADCIIIDSSNGILEIYVTYEVFARKIDPSAEFNSNLNAWKIDEI